MRQVERAVFVVVLGTVIGVSLANWGRVEAQGVEDDFVGTWVLEVFNAYDTDGNATDRMMTGRIMYDEEGNMAAQLMPTGETDERVIPGYFAYFGRYTVDAAARTVTHHVEGSNIASWVGTDLVRYFEFADGKLTLSLKSGDRVTNALVWRTARPVR